MTLHDNIGLVVTTGIIISTDIQALLLGKKAKQSSWIAGVSINGHSGERRCGSSQMSGKEARWWQSFAMGGHTGER